MSKDNNEIVELFEVIGEYLDDYVKIPALETVEKDFYAQNRLADALLLLQISTKLIQNTGLEFENMLNKILSHAVL